MSKLEVTIVECEERKVYGIWKKSNDASIAKDINTTSAEYNQIVGVKKEAVLPYFVLSCNYDETTKEFELFIGSTKKADGLTEYEIPKGLYGCMNVCPKLGFLWGPAIGEAKQYFYAKWIKEHPYRILNMEYEYHTEKSIGKKPSIEIMFAIEKQ